MFCLTWRYNWNTAVISNGSAQLELKMEKNTRFFRVSRLETQAHRCLVPGGTKSTYGLFMWPREKLDITVMEEGNLTNNNVVEYTLLSRSVLTASFSRKKKGAVTQGNPSTESNAIPCTQDTKSSHKPSESNNHLIPLYSLTSAFGAILCGKAGAESYRNAVLGEISRE